MRLHVRRRDYAVAVGCRQHEPGDRFRAVMEGASANRRQHRPMIVQAGVG